MLFSYISPVSIAISSSIQFALLDNVQFIHGLFYPSTRGHFTFHFNLPAAQDGVCVPLTPSIKNSPHRSPHITPTQNCIKFPHNSTNHFDNHFDAPSKYTLTTTYNKLSDSYKIHPNLPKSEKYTTLTLTYRPLTTAIHPKTIPQPSL